MTKLVSIDPDERLVDRVQQRDAALAVAESRRAVTMTNFYLAYLARYFPGVIAVGAMDLGSAPGALPLRPAAKALVSAQ